MALTKAEKTEWLKAQLLKHVLQQSGDSEVSSAPRSAADEPADPHLPEQMCAKKLLSSDDPHSIYRFRLGSHNKNFPSRWSFRELIGQWEKADPAKKKDCGSFPEVRKRKSSKAIWAAATLCCTCKRCANGQAVEWECKPYAFGDNEDQILVHKHKHKGERCAVILGTWETPNDYRVWGAYKDDHTVTAYNEFVQLREKGFDIDCGIEGNENNEDEYGEDGDYDDDAGGDHVPVVPVPRKRKRGRTSENRPAKRQCATRKSYFSMDSQQDSDEEQAGYDEDEDEDEDADMGDADKNTGNDNFDEANDDTDDDKPLKHVRASRASRKATMPTTAHHEISGSSERMLDPTSAPAIDTVNNDATSPPAVSFDISAAYRGARKHVIEKGMYSIAKNNLEFLHSMAEDKDVFGFKEAYDMINEQLTAAGVEVMPAL